MVLGEGTFDFIDKETVTFQADQGDLTTANVDIGPSGTEELGQTWTSPILEGNLVIMSADMRVKNALAGNDNLVGVANAKSAPKTGEQVIPTDPGTFTGATAVFFEVPIEIFGDRIRKVPLSQSGAAAALGFSITHGTTVHTWIGTGSLSNDSIVVVAGTPAATDPPATCVVLFGREDYA